MACTTSTALHTAIARVSTQRVLGEPSGACGSTPVRMLLPEHRITAYPDTPARVLPARQPSATNGVYALTCCSATLLQRHRPRALLHEADLWVWGRRVAAFATALVRPFLSPSHLKLSLVLLNLIPLTVAQANAKVEAS